MNSSNNWLVHDHSQFEELLSQCLDAVEVGDSQDAAIIFKELIEHLKVHMAKEDNVLFIAYETKMGIDHGPTAALRQEHNKIVNYIRDIHRIIKDPLSDLEHVLDCLRQLEILMHKHHEKEEDIFLPMASLLLDDNRDQILKQLKDYAVTSSDRKWDT